jgi:acetyl-CoA carboxylase alpha subunit
MDGIVPEPEGGAHADHLEAARNLKTAIVASLRELVDVPPEELVAKRYDRFRMFGTPGVQPVLPRLEKTND